ncbi:MAG: hypothetical protein ACFFEW_18145, partial [Candidatus Thorarchaeota archaeon]
MRKPAAVSIWAIILVLLPLVSALADWEPADGHKMHFPQLPNTAGWDVNANYPIALADDWLCTESGWIQDIHFWGSWMHGVTGQIQSFLVRIYSDIPADPPAIPYSKPGTLLWELEVTDYIIATPTDPPGPEGWYDPSAGLFIPDDHVDYMQYNIFLDSANWFYQAGGQIYWLSISALVADPTNTQWGWKSTSDRWNDDGVWAFWDEFNWIDLWEPPGFMESLNLAFVITGAPAECGPTQDGLGCIDVDCPNSSDSCQPLCAQVNPLTEKVAVLECACIAPDSCHVDMTANYTSCVVPDNGTGTADLPPVGCEYVDPYADWMIIDDLPEGTTIEMDGILMDFVNITTGSGGSLGGEYQQYDATLDLTVSGTGDLAGFNRHLAVPVTLETHSAPRTPGDPVQSFATVIYQMQGQLFGDPDFCELIVRAGNNLGLPGPGHTTLSELAGGDFAVESFFDVTYQIEFDGCPGSLLQDYSGITTATIRIETGALPPCAGNCPPGEACEQIVTYNPDGTAEVCCQCVPLVCEPNPDSSACKPGTCLNPEAECQPTCARMNTGTGEVSVVTCECQDAALCHVDITSGGGNPCVVPDNGTGTADLPPVGCEYVDPYADWMIIDGLPEGTTIEMDGILMDFVNITTGSGGSLGGEYQQYDATLDLTVSGTGDLAGFNRHLAVPVTLETHSAPRTPGDPVQSFATVIYQMQGQLFGDPDFCELIVRAGNNLGLPGPGHTTLSELAGGDFAVESFFDVTYQIEFDGCPGSLLQDYSGITTATIRIKMGAEPPLCAGNCPDGQACEQTIVDNGDGTVDICCQCV